MKNFLTFKLFLNLCMISFKTVSVLVKRRSCTVYCKQKTDQNKYRIDLDYLFNRISTISNYVFINILNKTSE